MTATLPASALLGHKADFAEWNQYIRAISAMSNIQVFNSNGISVSTAVTSYGNVTGALVNLAKHYDSPTSDVGLLLMIGSRTGTASAVVSFGINDGTSDHDIAAQQMLTANKHYYAAGFTTITGLAAGSYAFQLRWKHSTTATNAVIDTNDTVSLLAIELPN